MQTDEIRDAGRLAGAALSGVGSLARDVHQAVAGRVFRALGGSAAPVRALHDGIATTVYRATGASLQAAAVGGATALAYRARPDAPSATETTRGGLALGALNGAIGDRLADEASALALPMRLRRRGRDVVPDSAGLAAAYPDASLRLAVFVHGLTETEDAWRLLPFAGREGRPTYGERLQDELGFTPLELRYNTGRRVSDNGRELAALLDEVVAHWPVPVDDIVLVGHSMGGLVSRSACHHGERAGQRWTQHVRHVFSLGTPHLGADLEKAANVAGWALARLPETRPFAKIVNGRSVGIKDLRYGSLSEDDWREADPDEFLRDRCQEVPFLEGATYCFIGSTIAPGPLGRAIGDLLVRMPSASGRGSGRGRSIPFEVDNGLELTGLTHFDLLNHPAVYEQLRTWLTRPARGRPALPAAS